MAEPGAGGDNCCAAIGGAADGTRCKCPDSHQTALVSIDQKRRTAVTLHVGWGLRWRVGLHVRISGHLLG